MTITLQVIASSPLAAVLGAARIAAFEDLLASKADRKSDKLASIENILLGEYIAGAR